MQPKIHLNLVFNPGEEKLDPSKDRCPALEVHLLTFWVPSGGSCVGPGQYSKDERVEWLFWDNMMWRYVLISMHESIFRCRSLLKLGEPRSGKDKVGEKQG